MPSFGKGIHGRRRVRFVFCGVAFNGRNLMVEAYAFVKRAEAEFKIRYRAHRSHETFVFAVEEYAYF